MAGLVGSHTDIELLIWAVYLEREKSGHQSRAAKGQY